MWNIYAYGTTIRVYGTDKHTIRLWYVPYAYGMKYAYGTQHFHNITANNSEILKEILGKIKDSWNIKRLQTSIGNELDSREGVLVMEPRPTKGSNYTVLVTVSYTCSSIHMIIITSDSAPSALGRTIILPPSKWLEEALTKIQQINNRRASIMPSSISHNKQQQKFS